MTDREQMVARQRALAEFGELALRSDSLDKVLEEACRIVAAALGTDLAKVLEIQPEAQELLVKAGIGWRPGIVGQTRISMGEWSSEAYAIETAEPVIMQDIGDEERFDIPDFLKEHDVVALVNVPIFLPGRKPYGLLQVDSRTPREFDQEDIEFLRTYATILGPCHRPPAQVPQPRAGAPDQPAPAQELQHRVKNQFTIIASLLRMGTRQAKSDETRRNSRR
jgi:signal transduction protein with GAF and PtsI domain